VGDLVVDNVRPHDKDDARRRDSAAVIQDDSRLTHGTLRTHSLSESENPCGKRRFHLEFIVIEILGS